MDSQNSIVHGEKTYSFFAASWVKKLLNGNKSTLSIDIFILVTMLTFPKLFCYKLDYELSR